MKILSNVPVRNHFATLAAYALMINSFLFSCTGQRSLESPGEKTNPFGLNVPDGFVVEDATLPGMVSHPMFATFDHNGRLFVIESSGKTTSTEDVLKNPTFQILLLKDEDGDGVFDKRSVFADKIPYPMGGTFYRGSFYATAPPDVIRFTDTDGDDVADKREVILTGWTLNHNAATLSGPFFGPDGWMYMCDARRGFNITTKEGAQLAGKGARIWRCRPDGSNLEWVSGGGFDNTIELIFMPSGETIGTMTYFTDPQDGFRDALMHWVEGGVYPKPFPVIEQDNLKRTGDLMPVMTKLPRVSPSGLMRYKGSAFGKDYAGNLFSAQFNTGRIMRHIVSPDGATYRTVDEPFMTSDNLEGHPTDVLEDADGSLLVVNTGGWFIAGCPLSVVAKTDVLGGLYRIRKKDAPLLKDPRGKDIDFESSTPERLTTLMGDERPVVRERAIGQLVSAGADAVEALKQLLRSSADDEVRASAAFALYRIETPAALAALRSALDDQSPLVRTAAARCLGMAKDANAVEKLSRILDDTSLPVRRQAATALGQIGVESAAVALLEVSARAGDRFVDHAITHSLIMLGKPEPLIRALTHSSDNVRKTALIALDQIEGGFLREAHVQKLLESTSPVLQKSALWVAGHHPEWSAVVLSYMKKVFAERQLTDDDRAAVSGLIATFSGHASIRSFVASQLSSRAVSREKKLFLLGILKHTEGGQFHAVMKTLLEEKDPAVQAAALEVIQSHKISSLDEKLQQLFRDAKNPSSLRVHAMRARLRSQPSLSDEEFKTILGMMGGESQPYEKQAAVGLLVQADLSEGQLQAIAEEIIPKTEIYLLPGLVSSFEGSKSEHAGKALVAALSAAPDRLDHVSMDALQKLLKTFPPSVNESAGPLLTMLKVRQADRLSALEKIESSLVEGDVGEGRKLFFGKALCSSCHAITGNGGTFGPDLTNIGEIRSRHDILEAIVYPSASFAREYETSKVVTAAAAHTGIIKQQLSDFVILETGPGVTVRLSGSEISAIEPASLSLMPPGLHEQLGTRELSDLMAYLATLPDGLGHLRSGGKEAR